MLHSFILSVRLAHASGDVEQTDAMIIEGLDDFICPIGAAIRQNDDLHLFWWILQRKSLLKFLLDPCFFIVGRNKNGKKRLVVLFWEPAANKLGNQNEKQWVANVNVEQRRKRQPEKNFHHSEHSNFASIPAAGHSVEQAAQSWLPPKTFPQRFFSRPPPFLSRRPDHAIVSESGRLRRPHLRFR